MRVERHDDVTRHNLELSKEAAQSLDTLVNNKNNAKYGLDDG
jgi:hypothetical protein